jgi:predicted PhzF superfamily epimerase YddE/YHI9
MKHRFDQLDVFGAAPLRGNPLAVVHDAAGLRRGDGGVRALDQPVGDRPSCCRPPMPGPTTGCASSRPAASCRLPATPRWAAATPGWPRAGGRARPAWWCSNAASAWWRCAAAARAGAGTRWAFEAPPLRRSGPLDAALLQRIRDALGLDEAAVRAHQWVDNGPGWCAVLLDSAARVRALAPDWQRLGELKLGVVGPHAAGAEPQFELRALFGSGGGGGFEDPVTGSLNASVAQWLTGAGLAPHEYVAGQGAALHRDGRVFIERDGDTVWVGGAVHECIRGEVEL